MPPDKIPHRWGRSAHQLGPIEEARHDHVVGDAQLGQDLRAKLGDPRRALTALEAVGKGAQ
jgi:hypothetical protein